MRAVAAARAAVVLSALISAACSQILGIEDASVDPTLAGVDGNSPQGGTTASSTAAAAGEANEASGSSAGGSHNHGDGGSGASGTTPTAGSSPTAGASPDEPDLCERYCDQITQVCKGKYEQYRTFDQCVRVCRTLPPGEEGDKDTNTVSCRLRQAVFAESEPFVYCKSAGPLGEGKCGSNCISYCGLMQQACTQQSTNGNLEPSYFDSSQACLTACAELPEPVDGPAYYSSSASVEPTSFVGNTVFCRTYHLAAALEQDTPDEHCPHAMGGDPCVAQ